MVLIFLSEHPRRLVSFQPRWSVFSHLADVRLVIAQAFLNNLRLSAPHPAGVA
jgi:hypothetical protein